MSARNGHVISLHLMTCVHCERTVDQLDTDIPGTAMEHQICPAR